MTIQKVYLTPNPYSRPQIPIGEIKGVVIHWVGNAGSQALANRNYFEGLKIGKRNKQGALLYASSHYIVGLKGEVLACIPETEVAYHAGQANSHYLGIEVCHPDTKGAFNKETYTQLITLVAAICKRYGLAPHAALLRHYDVTGKHCPLYYVQQPQAWENLKRDVAQAVQETLPQNNIEVMLNGQIKVVKAIKQEGHYYVKLRDLADEWLAVGYEASHQRPTLEVRKR